MSDKICLADDISPLLDMFFDMFHLSICHIINYVLMWDDVHTKNSWEKNGRFLHPQ